ncbi:hypothetical protein BS47DRAFT_1143099 [Hydnum rufescens UP504]|uniref:Uncharacterized protein n=1 Tax=Hydnum rufescens UP504 TaxID=1448309 RepID=A0A9P6DVG4_9AGAM|nr:hypothetical protein BS47DRAFT_1143099 [Hydnum rufescens UP504]
METVALLHPFLGLRITRVHPILSDPSPIAWFWLVPRLGLTALHKTSRVNRTFPHERQHLQSADTVMAKKTVGRVSFFLIGFEPQHHYRSPNPSICSHTPMCYRLSAIQPLYLGLCLVRPLRLGCPISWTTIGFSNSRRSLNFNLCSHDNGGI